MALKKFVLDTQKVIEDKTFLTKSKKKTFVFHFLSKPKKKKTSPKSNSFMSIQSKFQSHRVNIGNSKIIRKFKK